MKTVSDANTTREIFTTESAKLDSNNSVPTSASSGRPSQAEPDFSAARSERERLIMEVEAELKIEREIRTKKFMDSVARQEKSGPILLKKDFEKSVSHGDSLSSPADEPICRPYRSFGTGRLPSPESLIPPEQRKMKKTNDKSIPKYKSQ